jgi:micrococcal nuclease
MLAAPFLLLVGVRKDAPVGCAVLFTLAFLIGLIGNNDSRYEYPATVTDAHDGDTVTVDLDLGLGVWLRGQKIRLYGLDTPELGTEAGARSKTALVTLLADRDVIVESIADKKDKYGRWLGRLWIKGTGGWCATDAWCNVNEWLLTNKYAKPYYGSSKKKEEPGQ